MKHRRPDFCKTGYSYQYRQELENVALSGSQLASLFLCKIYNWGFGADKSQSMTWAWI
jgi:hypothetical protein